MSFVSRLLCRDSGGETESMLLNETVPQWVIDITVDVSTRRFLLVKVVYCFGKKLMVHFNQNCSAMLALCRQYWSCRTGEEYHPGLCSPTCVSKAHDRWFFFFFSSSEKYAQVQQNSILPPASLFLRCKNLEEVSAPSLVCSSIRDLGVEAKRWIFLNRLYPPLLSSHPTGTASQPVTCYRWGR